MSYKRAIESRKEELIVLEKALKEAKKEKNQKQVGYLEPRILGIKETIKELEHQIKLQEIRGGKS